jgi:hypothetical protein
MPFAICRCSLNGPTMPRAFDRTASLYAQVIQAVPEDLRPHPDEHGLDIAFVEYVGPMWARFFVPLNRYIAAKAFASWTAYQGRGVASIVRGLEAALAVVRVEAARQCRDAKRHLDADLLRDAFRSADFILNHLAVGEDSGSRLVSGRVVIPFPPLPYTSETSKTAITGPWSLVPNSRCTTHDVARDASDSLAKR